MESRAGAVAVVLMLGTVGAAAGHAGIPSATQAPPQTPAPVVGTASVTGRAVAADTGAPLRAATVVLRIMSGNSWSATTDADGRFLIDDLPAGTYTLRITKAAFVPATFGRTPREVGTFELAAGRRIDRGDLPVYRAGVITGRIVDEFGEPAVAVHVSAMRTEYFEPGVRRVVAAQTQESNDLGEFRLYGLPPGSYFLVASRRLLQFTGADNQGNVHRFVGSPSGGAPTFYPGTASATDAQRVLVTLAQTTAIGDLRLLHVPYAQISGTVVSSSGQPAPKMVVMLHPLRADGALLPIQANMIETDAQGGFSLPNVAPGEYRLDVETMARMDAIGQSGSSRRPASAEHDEFASEPVSVRGTGIPDLVIRTTRGHRVSGRVVVEGEPLRSDQLQKVNVALTAMLPGEGVSAVLQSRSAQVAADGTFSANGVSGARLIRLFGLPATHVLKTVRIHGEDAADRGADIRDDVRGVEVVVSSRPTVVKGIVMESSGAPTKAFMVAVFPEDAQRWTLWRNRYVAALRPDATGGFSITGLPAGDYYALAVDMLDDGEWAEPENLARLRATATRFTLAEGETRALTLVRR